MPQSPATLAAGLLPLILLAGCQAEPTKPSPSPTSAPGFAALITDNVVASVTVVPDSQLTIVGERFKVTAKPKNAAGQVLAKTVRWTVADPTVAKALDSLKAIMTFKALKVGITSIKATVDGKSKSSKIVVRSSTGAKLVLTPATVSVAPGGKVQFVATGRTQAGETAVVSPTWTATGGTISGQGLYAAGSTTGTFRVIATARFGAADTSSVTITGTSSTTQVVLVPASATVTAGGSVGFAAYGRTSSGDSVALAVTYTATGGTIANTGGYTAGSTTGTYRVIAKSAAGAADTSGVTITTAPISSVKLLPGTAASRPGATTLFVGSAWNTLSESVSAVLSYQTNCGTITSTGSFTAAQEDPAECRVMASSDGKGDTTDLVLLTDRDRGIPLGLFELWRSATTTQTSGVAPYTASFGNTFPAEIVNHIAAARAKGVHLVLALTGGSHQNYTTDGVFDQAKWQATMDGFDTPAIRDAVAQAVADGTIIGESVMDEPQQDAGDSKSWGPPGFMTKVRVDGLCAYVKAIFPTLAVGVTHDPTVFEPDKSYQVCEFMLGQYAMRKGDVVAWRDAGLAIANRDKMAIIFSMNVLNGGKQDRDGTYDCAGTGGLGTSTPNCRMTPEQVREWGNLLGPAGCAMMMWRYDGTFMAKPENQASISDIAINLSRLARTPCTSDRTANVPPTAAFASSCNALDCSFSDGSTDADGSVAAWHWEFGDGATSAAREPSHTYADAGEYQVTLTVTDDADATATVTHTVTVTAPPPANASPLAAFSSNCTDLACSFTDESTDGDGILTAWSWDFGDGSTSAEQHPSHTYSTEGSYQVTLMVTDDDAATGTVTQSVSANAPPAGP